MRKVLHEVERNDSGGHLFLDDGEVVGRNQHDPVAALHRFVLDDPAEERLRIRPHVELRLGGQDDGDRPTAGAAGRFIPHLPGLLDDPLPQLRRHLGTVVERP
ncbi:hypothetical protein SDC9_147099 [bioreactor metagenome]|uniref:Uncharacterized protein n=1 Tax=bioreactor metagenome TaxID=1076179 RepID=A0A645ECZ1_9ZZZZ